MSCKLFATISTQHVLCSLSGDCIAVYLLTLVQMENTLDSIRPSGNPQEEMSYLFGRDPSILAYSQRPLPSKDTKKNLLSLYEIEESTSTRENTYEHSESLQTVKVYLRLKPFPKKLKPTEEQQDAYKIVNSTTLVTKLPILDNTINSIKQSKSNEIISRKFTFSQTFGPETTQLELFEQTVQQQMVEFLAGHSCTIMTYGKRYYRCDPFSSYNQDEAVYLAKHSVYFSFLHERSFLDYVPHYVHTKYVQENT